MEMGVFAYPPETSAPFRGDMQKPPTTTIYTRVSADDLVRMMGTSEGL